MIDIENAVIVDVEATPARTYDEVAATKTMIERTEERLDLKPGRLAADMAYGTGDFLGWHVGTGITPHIPVWEGPGPDDATFNPAVITAVIGRKSAAANFIQVPVLDMTLRVHACASRSLPV